MQAILDQAEIVMKFFAPLVLLYALLLALSIFAQSPYERELDHRLLSIEGMQLERRITILETLQAEAEKQAVWSKFGVGGVGLLLFEASIRLLKKKPFGG